MARSDIQEPRQLTDPEGNRVTLVPVGYRGITQIGLLMRVRDAARHRRFLRDTLDLEESDGAFRLGEGLFFLEEWPAASGDAAIHGPGWRYITFQIFDACKEHAHFLAKGGRPGMALQQLRDVASFAMVRDPDGNWIELSQRASLVGALTD